MPGTTPAEDAPLVSGRISRYELRVRLGEGNASVVYKAWDPELERWVALRLISPGLAGQGEERKPLIREAFTVASLEHPNIGPVYDVGEAADGCLFLVSALCEGETVATRLGRGSMRLEVVVALATQIAAAVGRAHEHGILHGRIRPSNVWVGGDGQVRVVDFGLSGLEERTWRTLRVEPAVKEYMAPELLLGETVSPRSDVWAIGAVLVVMLGRQEGLPGGDLLRIVDRALSSRPSDRHASAGALRDDLRTLRDPSPRPVGRAPGRPPDLSGVRRFSQYRIGELIGGGGMGVVYRAEDVQLGRTVALKFLSADSASDPAAKARFLQEARAASALDHPNICTVYEIGETEENQLYLAMPCYEGETLKARIGRGPLPMSEALDYALQVTKGLARAHRQGIIHRDIKPANLIITTDGLVKILDFGVAKLVGEATLTRTGAAVGTAAYMAPEQIRGELVDARADLWSLGVVLHEMATGRRPFPGDNSEAVRHAVLNRDPEPLVRLRPDAPPGLSHVVRGLLGKEPGDRYPTADAVATELGRLLGLTSTPVQVPATTTATATKSRKIKLPWRIVVPALLLAGMLAVLLPRMQSGLLGKKPATQAPTVVQLTDQGGLESFPSLSPDASFFAYAKLDGNDQDIFIQRVGGGKPINLTADSPSNDTFPAYSPDGKWIAFRSEREGGGIFIMGATGESVRRLTNLGYQPAWSPDSRSIAFATEGVSDPMRRRTISQLWRVDVATGRWKLLTKGDAVQPTWSPGGRRIAYWTYWESHGREGPQKALWTIPAGGGDPKLVLKDEFQKWNPVWSTGDGYLYFLSERNGSMNLWRVQVDEETGKVKGGLEPVTVPARSVMPFSLSRDGRRLLYSTEEGRSNIDRHALDPVSGRPQGMLQPVTRIMRDLLSSSISPDGQWIATVVLYPKEDLYLIRSDGSGFRQLTDDAYPDRRPQWSPDGKWIYFYSKRNHYEAWAIRPDGSGARLVVRQPDGEIYNPLPSPDGRWLACSDGFQGAALVDLALPPDKRSPRLLRLHDGERYTFVARSWAPDGKSLAGRFFSRKTFEAHGMGLYSLQTQLFEVLPEDGENLSFLGAGQILLYLRDGAVHGMDRRTRRSWLIAAPPPDAVFSSFTVSPDGRALYAIRSSSEGDLWMLETSNS